MGAGFHRKMEQVVLKLKWISSFFNFRMDNELFLITYDNDGDDDVALSRYEWS